MGGFKCVPHSCSRPHTPLSGNDKALSPSDPPMVDSEAVRQRRMDGTLVPFKIFNFGSSFTHHCLYVNHIGREKQDVNHKTRTHAHASTNSLPGFQRRGEKCVYYGLLIHSFVHSFLDIQTELVSMIDTSVHYSLLDSYLLCIGLYLLTNIEDQYYGRTHIEIVREPIDNLQQQIESRANSLRDQSPQSSVYRSMVTRPTYFAGLTLRQEEMYPYGYARSLLRPSRRCAAAVVARGHDTQ